MPRDKFGRRPERFRIRIVGHRVGINGPGLRLQERFDLLTITAPRKKKPQRNPVVMHRSTDRFLTTHVGSLIRPESVRAHLRAKQKGEGYDAAAHAQTL